MSSDHPLLRNLRAFREPTGVNRQIIDALCREHPSGELRWRLPTDGEIAAELHMPIGSVKSKLKEIALQIDGLERLDRRARVYCWFVHRQWELKQ